MHSTIAALLWQIWWRHRSNVVAVALLTALGRGVDAMEAGSRADGNTSPLTVLIAMFAFLILLGIFNYTESAGERALGSFPRRLLALPVTTLRLVAVPVVAGIAAIELLYLLWREPLSRGGSASPLFVAVLLAALVMFYLWTLWTLERSGSLRLLALGVIAMLVFVIGQLPSFAPSPPPVWRSEWFLGAAVSALAAAAFLLSWRHVDQLRSGGVSSERSVSLADWMAAITPPRQRAFANAAAAQFWYEWRAAGLALPMLVAGSIALVILPMSWSVRSSGPETFRLLLLALATPIVIAVPVGMAFSKPNFWSEDLAVPSFVAVRPLSCEDLIAIKIRVATLSSLLAWGVVLAFVGIWLAVWGNVDSVGQFLMQLWAFHEHSVAKVYALVLLVLLAGFFLTCRALVSRLWSGLSGNRFLVVASVTSIGTIFVVALALDADELPAWVLADPVRLAPFVWIAAIAVIIKYWLAAYTWRRLPLRHAVPYLMMWAAGTASMIAFSVGAWSIMRVYLAIDASRLLSLLLLLALLTMPIARVGQAPASLARNRHRR